MATSFAHAPASGLERVDACDLCGGRHFRLRRVWRDDLLFGSERWRLVECLRCSLHFLDPRPTTSHIGAFYPTTYAAHTDAAVEPKSWHRRVSARDAKPGFDPYLHVRQALSWYRMPAWRGDGRVLDVGCGNGGRYLDVLKALGWKTFGVDPSPAAITHLRDNGHVGVVGSAEEQHFDAQSMDVVTMWHVLEHTHSPARALRAAFTTLRPGGTLSLSVPNYHGLQAQLLRGLWCGVEVPRHLFQFTRRTLSAYLADAGFRIVDISTRTGATSWPRAVRHALNRVFGTRWRRDPAWIVALFEPFAILGSLVRFLGLGCELRVLAQRPE